MRQKKNHELDATPQHPSAPNPLQSHALEENRAGAGWLWWHMLLWSFPHGKRDWHCAHQVGDSTCWVCLATLGTKPAPNQPAFVAPAIHMAKCQPWSHICAHCPGYAWLVVCRSWYCCGLCQPGSFWICMLWSSCNAKQEISIWMVLSPGYFISLPRVHMPNAMIHYSEMS